jgi:hypothetical protein
LDLFCATAGLVPSSNKDASRSQEHCMNQDNNDSAHQAEQLDEVHRIHRLQFMMNLVMQVIAQDSKLTFEEASQMIADSRTAALAMFPGKELAYDLLYRPRFQRLMQERFRLQ